MSASGEIAAWRNVSVLTTIDEVEIAGLKRESGKNIVMYGSLSVVRALSDLSAGRRVRAARAPCSTLPSTLSSSSRHIPFGQASH